MESSWKEELSKYDLRMAQHRMSLITDSGLGSSSVIILYREALQLPPKLDTALATLDLLDPLDERATVEDLILRGEESRRPMKPFSPRGVPCCAVEETAI